VRLLGWACGLAFTNHITAAVVSSGLSALSAAYVNGARSRLACFHSLSGKIEECLVDSTKGKESVLMWPAKVPKNLAWAYCLIGAVFSYAVGGMMWDWFFDWHAHFGEWEWFYPVGGSLMIVCGVGLTVCLVHLIRGEP
jgi:zinc transporter ZupT